MVRPDALAALRRHLRTGAELSPADLARHLGVGERQARRVARGLGAAEPPLRARTEGRQVWYGYAPEDLALLDPPEPLTEDEAFAVYVALATARPAFAATPLAGPLDAAAAKLVPPGASILTFEPDDGRFATVGPGAQAVRRDVFTALRRAVRDGHAVTLTYTNARGARRADYGVDPYGVVVAGGSWQLVGRSHRRDAVVRFSLPDVEAVAAGEAFGGPPAGFDLEAYVREALGGYAGGEVETVRLDVSAQAASSFRRKAYHPTQVTEQTRPDGSAVVSFEVALTPDLTSFVRAFGAAVRVTDPPALAADVAASARATLALYEA